MKSNEIKVGNIYNVDFNPIVGNEFAKKHLAVVLKKNVDKQTFAVIPLTSSKTGEGINKYCVGRIAELPHNLRDRDTYAVYDQIRVVDFHRFSPLLEDATPIQVKFPEDKFKDLITLVFNDLLYGIADNNKILIIEKLMNDLYRGQIKDSVMKRIKETGLDAREYVPEVISEVEKISFVFPEINDDIVNEILTIILKKR